MTLHKIKEVFVDEEKLLTQKELTSLVIRIALSTLGITLDLGFLASVLLGVPATILVIAGSILAFNWVFDLLKETPEALKRIRFYGNIFPLFYALLIAEFLILKYLRFI